MKKILMVMACLLAGVASAQTGTVSGTVMDTDGQAWINGTWTAVLALPNGAFRGAPTIGGTAVVATVKGLLGGDGAFSMTLMRTDALDQAGGQWTITACPNASVPQQFPSGCYAATFPLASSSLDLSPRFAGVPAPRFPSGPGAFGYRDIEVSPTLPGSSYYNTGTTNPGLRIWNGRNWASSFAGVQASPAASQTVTQPAGTALTINGDFRAGTVTSGVVNSAPNSAVRAIIYDDDCANDWDCLFTMADLQYWVNTQNVSVAAVVANSSNPSAAPMIHLLNAYYGHGGIPVGAWQGSNPATGSDSTWVASTVANFCPSSGLCPSGDTRANYPGCVATLRTALAAAANNSISYVETGFMTCLAALMQSPADSISALTGAQLLQAKVSQLDVMGGQYPNSSASASNECIPAGGAEFNFACDAADAAYVMSNWTSQNGYPPMYLNGYSIGATVNSGVPYWFPSSDPVVYGSGVAGTNSRPSWDALSLCHAVLGNAGCGMTLSASGTNTVNASTGANTWASTTASGQYYVTKSQPDTFYQAILDGINYNGANRAYPAMAGSINGYLGLQSNSVFPGYIPRLVVGVAGNSSNVPFTAIGGKVASFSSDSNYGQIQIANPAMAAEGIGFLDCMTAPANLGDAPGTGTCGTNWALGTSAFGASGFALGNARLGSWEMNLDDHGDMTLRGDGGGTNFGTNLKLDSTMMTGGHLWTMASGGSSDFAGAGSLSLTDNTAGILRWWIDGGGSSYQQAAIPAANSSWLSTIKNTQAPAAGDYLKGQAQLCPNLVAGAYCFTALGQGAAANNAFSLIFGYAGSGSPNNSLTVGSYQGPPIASFYADGSFALASTAGISCSSARAGVLNYIAGAAGVKDTVQVCAKDASNAWAWRTIY